MSNAIIAYTEMLGKLNSQLLELEIMDGRNKKNMEETAFKAMECAVRVTERMGWTQLITGGAGSIFGLGSALMPNDAWQKGFLAVAQNAPTAGQFFTTKQQAELTQEQHKQQVATEKWRSKQDQVKQLKDDMRRSLDDLIRKIGEIFQAITK